MSVSIKSFFIAFQKGENALYVAMDYNNTRSIAVLLDYMHSVDKRVNNLHQFVPYVNIQ